jgi:hypothetical protein
MKKSRFLFAAMLTVVMVFVGSCSEQNGGGLVNSREESSGPASKPEPKPAPKPDIPDEPCHYNGHQLHVGPKGGCYYFYDGRKKEYVDHSFCKDCEKEKKGK